MCRLVSMNTNFGTTCKVADIKKAYIENILNHAHICPDIDKIVLFGSAIEERCKEISDIDIAIFGGKTEYDFLKSKTFKKFETAMYTFGDGFQDYDVLYFKTGKPDKSHIQNEIARGEVIYKKAEAV